MSVLPFLIHAKRLHALSKAQNFLSDNAQERHIAPTCHCRKKTHIFFFAPRGTPLPFSPPLSFTPARRIMRTRKVYHESAKESIVLCGISRFCLPKISPFSLFFDDMGLNETQRDGLQKSSPPRLASSKSTPILQISRMEWGGRGQHTAVLPQRSSLFLKNVSRGMPTAPRFNAFCNTYPHGSASIGKSCGNRDSSIGNYGWSSRAAGETLELFFGTKNSLPHAKPGLAVHFAAEILFAVFAGCLVTGSWEPGTRRSLSDISLVFSLLPQGNQDRMLS